MESSWSETMSNVKCLQAFLMLQFSLLKVLNDFQCTFCASVTKNQKYQSIMKVIVTLEHFPWKSNCICYVIVFIHSLLCGWNAERVWCLLVCQSAFNAHFIWKSVFFLDFEIWPRANFTNFVLQIFIKWERSIYSVRLTLWATESWKLQLVIIYSPVWIVCHFIENSTEHLHIECLKTLSLIAST